MIGQVVLFNYNRLHDDYRRSACGNMLSASSQRLYLYMGSRKRWTEVCTLLWFYCGLVVLHCMDDFHCWKLSGKSYLVT